MENLNYRQGDVIIKKIDKLDLEKSSVKENNVIAEGEVTGHAHRITQGEARLLVNDLLQSIGLSVLFDTAILSHEEHEDIVLPRGDYEIKIQREYDWFSKEVRRVAD